MEHTERAIAAAATRERARRTLRRLTAGIVAGALGGVGLAGAAGAVTIGGAGQQTSSVTTPAAETVSRDADVQAPSAAPSSSSSGSAHAVSGGS